MRGLWIIIVGAIGCGGNSPDRADAPPAPPIDAPVGMPVTVRFAATINGAPFACGQTYHGVGTPAADYEAQDFRMFVHDVTLLGSGGTRAAVTLTQDGQFQREALALLDFEDGSTGCDAGTPAVHTAISGTVAPGVYTGIELKIGVPDEMDHLDASTALPPLDDTTLWWVWRSGYKFVRIDGTANASNGFPFHLGATGCPGSSAVMPPTGPCAQPNIPVITLTGFDPTVAMITADLGSLFRGVNLAVNAGGSAQGCQSDVDDSDCSQVFANVGLPFGTAPEGFQMLLQGP